MLSCHPTALAKDASGKLLASAYARDWENPGSQLMRDHPKTTGREQLNTFDPHVVAKLVREFAWSPIVWAGGVRKSDCFAAALWCALDFDDGVYTLADACDDVASAGLTHVIGTTKSHGKAKDNAPACDRFRLLLRFDRVVDSRALYERAMRAAMQDFNGADKSCKDAARFFFPCMEIVSAAKGFGYWPIDDDETPPGPAPPRKQQEVKRNYPKSTRPLRDHEFDIIDRDGMHVQRFGKTRHQQLLEQTARIICRRGYSASECFEYLRPRFPSDRPDSEIWGSIKGAFEKGIGRRK
jgi:hypothetical protein